MVRFSRQRIHRALLGVPRWVRNIFLAALAFPVLPPFLGLHGAFELDLPAGPSIVVAGEILLLLTWGVRALVHRR